MKWTSKILLPIMIAVLVLTAGGVFASWNFYERAPHSESTDFNVTVKEFAWTGSEEMVNGETHVVTRFIEEINKSASETIIHDLIEAREDKGSWFAPIRELAADDPEATGLIELLGIDKYPELTVIIKFIDGTPGYELYTTRVDVDAKDSNGNYIITDEQVNNETMWIYPVNRTTFSVVDGKYEVDTVTIGYSRAIWYYEDPYTKSDIRTFDVVLWQEGKDMNTAITLETAVIGEKITIQNIDAHKEVWFEFTPNRTATYTFTMANSSTRVEVYNANGNRVNNYNLTRNNTYYIKVIYDQQDLTIGNMEFTISRN